MATRNTQATTRSAKKAPPPVASKPARKVAAKPAAKARTPLKPAPKAAAKAPPARQAAAPSKPSSKKSAPKLAPPPKKAGAQSKAAPRPVTTSKTTTPSKAATPAAKPAARPAEAPAKAAAKTAAEAPTKVASSPESATKPASRPAAAPEAPAKPAAKPAPPAEVPNKAGAAEAPSKPAVATPVPAEAAPTEAAPAQPDAAPRRLEEAPEAEKPAAPRPTIIVAAPPNMPIRSNNPNSPRPPMGRPNMPPSFAVRGPGRPGFAEAQAAAPRPPAAKIELKAGDHVVYPTHGVGTVQGIETIEAAGAALQMIVVTFDENRMTLRVPVNKVPTAGLRKLFTPKEFEEAIATLKGKARIKRTMWSRRAQEYEAKINSGDPIQIAEVVRDLQRNAGQPDQSFSERQIYEQALERLAAEYAAIEKIDKIAASEQLVAFAKST
jgi:CarD family transcriptional regulator